MDERSQTTINWLDAFKVSFTIAVAILSAYWGNPWWAMLIGFVGGAGTVFVLHDYLVDRLGPKRLWEHDAP
jgi:hypothetical protein